MIWKNVLYVFFFSAALFPEEVEGPKRKEEKTQDDQKAEKMKKIESSSNLESQPASETEERLIESADEFFQKNEIEDAIRLYNEAITIHPNEARYYRSRGLCHSKLNNLDSMIADYERAINLEPDNVDDRLFISRQLIEMGKLFEANKHLQKASAIAEKEILGTEEILPIIFLMENLKQKFAQFIKEQFKKLKELEDLRQFGERSRQQSFIYLKHLITRDSEQQIARIEEGADAENTNDVNAKRKKIRAVELTRDNYLEKLSTGFAALSVSDIPDHYCDKISFEIMREPVVTPSGITFDRAQIEKQLQYRQTNPLTREELHVHQLRPNKALKEAIDDYMKNKGLTYPRTVD